MRGARWGKAWGVGLLGAMLGSCAPYPGDDVLVSIFDWRYQPTHIRVKPGQTVRMLNLDTAPHSATSASEPGRFVPGESDGISFDTGPFLGEERAFTIPVDAVPGSFVPFFCTVHRDFQHGIGRLVVTE
jgi:plastocyanin